jgi:hypothetical protein
MPYIANETKLTLERSLWDNTETAIPYPKGFHPRDDDKVSSYSNCKMCRILRATLDKV